MLQNVERAGIDEPTGWDEPGGLAKAVVVGSIVGALIASVAVTAALLAIGVQRGSAFGLGVFIAFWGGLGFGSMVAGVVWATKVDPH
jgi:hypothetical protein